MMISYWVLPSAVASKKMAKHYVLREVSGVLVIETWGTSFRQGEVSPAASVKRLLRDRYLVIFFSAVPKYSPF